MTRLRAGVVVLLVWAAYWAALPWIDCARSFPFGIDIGFLSMCTFGFPFSDPRGLPNPVHWPNIVAGVIYLVAAVVVARRRAI